MSAVSTDDSKRESAVHSSTAVVEEALLTQFRQLAAIFDAMEVIVYVADLDTYELLYMNSYGKTLFGEGFAGRRCYDVLQTGQAGPCSFCTNDRLVRGGAPQGPYLWEFQNTITGRWFMCIDQAICWVDGRLVRMEVAIDISDRKAAEMERERLVEHAQRQAALLNATLSSMADGMVVCDTDGKIVWVNDVARRLLNYSPEQGPLPLRALSWLHLQTSTGELLAPDEAPLARAIERRETVQGLVAGCRQADGSTTWMSMSATPMVDDRGQLSGAVGTLTDITELHLSEERREDYLHMISHDLRNPLTPIIGMAGWLQRRLLERGFTEEAEGADLISESAQRIKSMTDDLVESARLEAGRFELQREPVRVCQLVRDIASRFGTDEQRLRLRLECPALLPLVEVDPDRIERAVSNLLNNAFKYSPSDEPVRLHTRLDGDEVVVSVENAGPGIRETDLPQVFERYFSVHAGKKKEGLGLGLYIARGIIEAHGGRIWAESVPGQTTFSFTLPLSPDPVREA